MRGVAFAVAYALLTLVGRATAFEGQVVSLVWPAAGVAVLWFLAEAPRHAWRVLLPLMAIHAVLVIATGVSPVVAFFGSLSVTVQTGVIGVLVRRWCPTLLGVGGTASIRSPRNLVATGVAACLGCAVGGLIGPVGLWLDGADVSALTAVAWFARHATGVLTVGAVGHLAWEWRTQQVPARTHAGSRAELVALWVVSVASTVGLFLQPYPLIFLVIALPTTPPAR